MFLLKELKTGNLDDLNFHSDLVPSLRKMIKDNSMPHLIFHGIEGSGKKTLINTMLRELYGNNVTYLKKIPYKIIGSGNTTTKVDIVQSPHHIIIDPNKNNFDRYIIQSVIKEYATKLSLSFYLDKKYIYKTILINNVGNLSYYAQTSLRRTLEKYSNTCRFIMWVDNLSKIIEPLQSRCLCIRVSSPTRYDIFNNIVKVNDKYNLKLEPSDYMYVIDKSNRNYKLSMWLLSLKINNMPYEISIDKAINEIINLIINGNRDNVLKIRKILYDLTITLISNTDIIRIITNNMCSRKSISFDKKISIIENAAKYEYRCKKSRREIIHLEAFIISIIC